MSGSSNSSTLASSSAAIWSTDGGEITFERLEKFWNELPLEARQELLRVDKEAFFEQAKRNLYCSKCIRLLGGNFTQIVSLQQENNSVSEDIGDPWVHPWGGLVATTDGILTLPDYLIHTTSLKSLQNVFDSAQERERERGILYPDVCGGGDDRGWKVHAVRNHGRGHGPQEACALHVNRLADEMLLFFWSALGKEAQVSLLCMKEDNFIERLTHRFGSKKFCRECRRNVLHEYKELKELKPMMKELLCTIWFCAADTAFQYQVTEDTIYANWQQCFEGRLENYHHFEWGVGTSNGKSDILDFEDVGKSVRVQVDGLDLEDLNACFITLRAWKLDGGCTEICVKAHALREQPCVHRSLMVGDGCVAITEGESIKSFFEYAEEVDEEEDDDAMDKDGNEYNEGSHHQAHARSPEVAREFLLDAATVIFKDQIEKAFRQGTVRQNAHNMFICFVLKLLEDKIHLACKEIMAAEKQNKLLEEEEKEKREEEERRERKRMKEREKKNRRKAKQKDKESEKKNQNNESVSCHADHCKLMTSHLTIIKQNKLLEEEEKEKREEEERRGRKRMKEREKKNRRKAKRKDKGSGKKNRNNESVSCHTESQSSGNDTSPITIHFYDSVSDPKKNISFEDSEVKEFSTRNYDGHADDKEFKFRESNPSYIVEQSKLSKRNVMVKSDCYLGKVSKWDDNNAYPDEFDTTIIEGNYRPSTDPTPSPFYRNNKYNATKQVWLPRSNSNPDIYTRTSDVSDQCDAICFDKTKISDELSQVNDSNNEMADICGDNRKNDVDCGKTITSLSSSSNSSSYPREVNNNSSKSSANQNTELLSTTSDYEDAIPFQYGEKTSVHHSDNKESFSFFSLR